eukprot:15066025-Ditylum_brightwellii.AAC.1
MINGHPDTLIDKICCTRGKKTCLCIHGKDLMFLPWECDKKQYSKYGVSKKSGVTEIKIWSE